MRKTGNSLIMPGSVVREKTMSAFKTISFLVSLPENEPDTNCSDCGDAGYHHLQVPDPQRNRCAMDGSGEVPRKNPGFQNDGDKFPTGRFKGDITFVTVSYPSHGEKTLTASSLPGNSCRDISCKKNDIVDYPGRSVLYSRQFRPLNRITSTEYKTPPDG